MSGYKLKDRGGCLAQKDKWYLSSKSCHYCSKIHPEMKNLGIRTTKCNCGWDCPAKP